METQITNSSYEYDINKYTNDLKKWSQEMIFKYNREK